jgi:hypothetical protein
VDVLDEREPAFGMLPEELEALALEARARAEPRIRRQFAWALAPVAVLAVVWGVCILSVFRDLV